MEGLEVKLVDIEKFLPTCKKWGEDREFPIPHPDNIEETYVCYKQNTPLYCCFAWTTKSAMCMIGYPIGNPFIPYKFREGALPFLIKEMSDFLGKRGYTKIWTSSGTKPVEKALVKGGFDLADPNVNVYIKTM